MTEIKDKQRSTTILVLALFLTLFVLINAQQFLLSAVVYLIIGVISIFLYSQWNKIGISSRPIGVDKNFIQDGLVGIGLGIGTILLGTIVPGINVIGIPNVQSVATTMGRIIILLVAAPVFEEILFRGFMLSYFEDKIKLNFWIANVIQAGLFALFHLTSYGSLITSGGAFWTAGLMAFIFGIVVKKQNSLIGAMAMHSTLNLWIAYLSKAIVL